MMFFREFSIILDFLLSADCFGNKFYKSVRKFWQICQKKQKLAQLKKPTKIPPLFSTNFLRVLDIGY